MKKKLINLNYDIEAKNLKINTLICKYNIYKKKNLII